MLRYENKCELESFFGEKYWKLVSISFHTRTLPECTNILIATLRNKSENQKIKHVPSTKRDDNQPAIQR